MHRRDVRVVAIDYDGTLAEHDQPSAEALRAIAELRGRGLRFVLVTGRILTELDEVFPDARSYFHVLIAENGGVLVGQERDHLLAEPVSAALADVLDQNGCPVRRGRTLLACDEHCDGVALNAIHRLGLDCHLVYNRHSLMVVPAGVTKGTGLLAAVTELGLSRHNTIAFGDAENDHALLDTAEVGIAVANSIDSLKAQADIALDEPDGAGIAGFLSLFKYDGPLPEIPRRNLTIGTFDDGEPVLIPPFGVNVLVAGGSASGKSFLGGALAERLIDEQYSVVVLDAEGDHLGLRSLAPVSVFSYHDGVPPVDFICEALRRSDRSVVLDLSECDATARTPLYSSLSHRLVELRSQCGRPHWIVIDEAHQPLGPHGAWEWAGYASGTGHCLITYQPHSLNERTAAATDIVIVLPRPALGADDPASEVLERFCTLSPEQVRGVLARADQGQAVIAFRDRRDDPRVFQLGPRRTPHVRHWHKYATAELPWVRRFFFERRPGDATGAVASNMSAFHHELSRCEAQVVQFHCSNHDFSRWIRDVLADDQLASDIHPIEERLARGEVGVPTARDLLLRVIEERYAN